MLLGIDAASSSPSDAVRLCGTGGERRGARVPDSTEALTMPPLRLRLRLLGLLLLLLWFMLSALWKL